MEKRFGVLLRPTITFRFRLLRPEAVVQNDKLRYVSNQTTVCAASLLPGSGFEGSREKGEWGEGREGTLED